ncbi:MAG: Uma2 family endonuclease, partial [Deltaproteobacteria bacterium]|nr:Uma2 family endonuclease [Deltaproteobacteria bacterium]
MSPLAKKKLDEKFNYADYLTWPDDERWEIIKGVAYDMSP